MPTTHALINRCGLRLEWAVVGLLTLMVLLLFCNVVPCDALSPGITASEELSRWRFVWL